jgi:hypothetical protein
VPPLTAEGVVLEMKQTKAEGKYAASSKSVPKASPRALLKKENP